MLSRIVTEASNSNCARGPRSVGSFARNASFADAEAFLCPFNGKRKVSVKFDQFG